MNHSVFGFSVSCLVRAVFRELKPNSFNQLNFQKVMSDFEKLQALRIENPKRFFELRLRVKIEDIQRKQKKGKEVFDFEIQDVICFASEHNLSLRNFIF